MYLSWGSFLENYNWQQQKNWNYSEGAHFTKHSSNVAGHTNVGNLTNWHNFTAWLATEETTGTEMVGDTGPYFTVWYNTVLILYDLESSSRNISTDPGDICLKLEVKHTGCGQTLMLAWKLLGANIILWVIKYVVLQMCLQISCLFFYMTCLTWNQVSYPEWDFGEVAEKITGVSW